MMLNRGPADLVDLRAYDPSEGFGAYEDDTFATELHAVLSHPLVSSASSRRLSFR
jgi:hypothetical protein